MRRRRKQHITIAAGVTVMVVLMVLGFWLRGPWYEVIDLGTLGGVHASAVSVNNVGQVVGWSTTDSPASRGPVHAFLWDQEHGMRDLGTLGGQSSRARDINDKGQVVGHALTDHGLWHAFLWDADNGMVDLGTLGGGRSHAYAINNMGQIVGEAETVDRQMHAFLWDAERGMVDLGSLYGRESLARDINEKGQVVGLVGNGPKDHAFYWDRETGMVDLVGTHGPSSFANGINNAGWISGYIFNAQKKEYEACIWTGKDGVERVDTRAIESFCEGINDRDQTIGHVKGEKFLFFGGGRHAFLRSAKGRIVNLSRYEPSKDHQVHVYGINDAGWIVGEMSAFRPSISKAVLLRPKSWRGRSGAVGQDD